MRKNTLISKLSLLFIKRFRVTILIFLGVMGLGLLSYTTLLPRDGFPSIAFPIAQINAVYFIDDAEQFDKEILMPIEEAISDIDEVDSYQSSTDGNFGGAFVQFKGDLTSDEATELLEDKIEENVVFPDGVQIVYTPLKVDSVDNYNDFLFALSSPEASIDELQAKAAEISEVLLDVNGIEEVNITNLIEQRVNPLTGEFVPSRENFTRVGIQEDGSLNFYDAVNIGVIVDENISSLDTSTLIRDAIDENSEELGIGGDYTVTYTGDVGRDITRQIDALETNFLTGMIAVLAVLVLFVSWRAGVVTVLFIPTVLAGTFIIMYALGATLNVISLFALILALGLFVDDAIVVSEAIEFKKREGLKGIEAVRSAISEVGAADIMGTVTTILVFAPMLFISGILGEFIAEMPRTMVIALAMSLTTALTIIPFLSNLLISDKQKGKLPQWRQNLDKVLFFIPNQINTLGIKVGEYTHNVLSVTWKRWTVGIASVLLVVGGLVFAGNMFNERFNPFPPTKDSDILSFSVSAPESADTDLLLEDIKTLEQVAKDVYEDEIVDYVYFFSNRNIVFGYVNLSSIDDREVKAPEMIDNLNAELENRDLNGSGEFAVISNGPPSEEYPFAVQVYADDGATLSALASEIAEFTETISFQDETATEVVIDNLDVIAKSDGRRYAQVKARLSDDTNTQIALDFQEQVREKFDADYLSKNYDLDEDALGFDLGQQSENIESLQSLGFIGLLAVVLMYILLVVQFDSFSQPLLIIFVAILFAFPGVFPGLYVTDNFVSFLTSIGMIGLIGIVVNNTIMLIDFANQARSDGKSAVEAISTAIRIRFRPLLATSITTVSGLLPLALQDPFWEPISYTIIFGLLASTTLVIFAFPVFYVTLEKLRENRKRTALIAGSILLVIIIITMLA